MTKAFQSIHSRASKASAPFIEISDPSLCCPTGLCGPVLDQAPQYVIEIMYDPLQSAFAFVMYLEFMPMEKVVALCED